MRTVSDQICAEVSAPIEAGSPAETTGICIMTSGKRNGRKRGAEAQRHETRDRMFQVRCSESARKNEYSVPGVIGEVMEEAKRSLHVHRRQDK